MEATAFERELWKKRDELEAEKAAMLAAVEPLEQAKARHQASAEAARIKIKDLETRIQERKGTRMAEVCRDLRCVAQALNGKKRPE